MIEHGTSPAGRWLRARRLKIAFWIAVAEALLVLFHVIPWYGALILAAIALVFYVALGRDLRSDVGRQLSWIAAASQTLMVLVPILVAIVGWLALIAVVLLAIVALVVLFADRR